MGARARAAWLLAVVMAAAGSTACGGSDGGSGGGGCEPPVLEGSPLEAEGTATLTGKGTLPDGIPDGLQLQMAVGQGGLTLGVLPDNLFSEKNSVCGKSLSYTIHKLEAGTYRLQFNVFDPNDGSDDVDTVFEGEAPSDFTVADGQTLQQDTVFTLTKN